jgi:hypothetical protein
MSSTPTAPVAPAMATTGVLLLRFDDDISLLPNEKGPAGFLAGPSVILFGSDQRAQKPKAPGALVLSVFLMIWRIMGREQ